MADTLALGARVALSLALVLAILWFLARRVGVRTTPDRRVPITVLGRQSLGRRSGVVVVEVSGRTLLLGVSETGVRLISEVDAPERATGSEPAAGSEDTDARSFADVLTTLGPPTAPPEIFAGRGAGVAARTDVPPLTGPRLGRTAGRPADDAPAPTREVPTGPLAGSVLDPATWTRGWTLLQERVGAR